LASLALQGPSFKIADKTHKKQTITVGQLKIEFSDVIGWVMRVQ
jgi:hypothetical protein